MQKYGHLRAGTYNIKSPRYDQMNNFEFIRTKTLDNKFKISNKILTNLDNLILNENLKNINSSKIF